MASVLAGQPCISQQAPGWAPNVLVRTPVLVQLVQYKLAHAQLVQACYPRPPILLDICHGRASALGAPSNLFADRSFSGAGSRARRALALSWCAAVSAVRLLAIAFARRATEIPAPSLILRVSSRRRSSAAAREETGWRAASSFGCQAGIRAPTDARRLEERLLCPSSTSPAS